MRWVCIVLALAALSSLTPAAAQALPQQHYAFDIPRGPLDTALVTFARQSGLQVARFNDRVLESALVGPLKGSFSAAEALTALLAPQGLRYRVVNAHMVAVVNPTDEPRPAASEKSAAQAKDSLPAPDPAPPVPQAATKRAEAALDEVIVTATRRSESSLKVPLSLVALNTEQLEKSNVKSIRDLSNIVPGVEFDVTPMIGATNISIRGISSTSGNSTTGVYVDDVAIQSAVGLASGFSNPYPVVFDLDRVEVIRGPQGTLFGAGAEGGAVRFIQKQPSLTTFSGRVVGDVSYTQYGAPSYEAGLAGGGPIVNDTLGFRASAWTRRDGGFVDRVNLFTGQTEDPNSNWTQSSAARLALTVAPVEHVTVTPSIAWQKAETHDTGEYYESLSDANQGRFRNGRLDASGFWDEFYLAGLTANIDAGFADLIAVSSYFERWGFSNIDVTGQLGALTGGWGNPLGPAYPAGEGDLTHQPSSTRRHSFSQELRLTSKDPDARLTWTAGLYFTAIKQLDASSVFSAERPEGNFVIQTSIVERQYALFGQTDLRLTDALKATVGVRATRHVVEGGGQQVFGTATGSYGTRFVDTPITPRYGLEYQLDPKNLLYASASKGYRAGGINAPLDPLLCGTGPLTYSEDTLWSYELGSKSRFLDGRAIATASVYRVVWNGIQQFVTAPCGTGYIGNLGVAHVTGFDLATQFQLTDGLRAEFSVTNLNARYTKDVTVLGLPIVQRGDAIGTPPLSPSPWSGTAALEYDFKLASRAAFLRAEETVHSHNPGPFVSEVPGSPSYNPDLRADPAVGFMDLYTGISLERLDLSAYLTNAFGTAPTLGRSNIVPGSNLWTQSTLRPRTVGIRVEAHF